MAGGRNPSWIWASMNRMAGSSLSRTRSSELGTAPPSASRASMSSSTGTPVRALAWAKVSSLSEEKRS